MRWPDRCGFVGRRWALIVFVVLACLPPNTQADCVDAAAAYHGVNVQVLRAIGYQESHLNPRAHNRNRNGSEDLGMFQINTIHLRELSRYGIGRQMLYDPCVNAYVAAWHLARKVQLHGNSWQAVGAYHSESAGENGLYARAIEGILNRGLPSARSPLATATRRSEDMPPARPEAAQPMRAIVIRRPSARVPENPARSQSEPAAPADDHWLDAMLANLNQSASLRERFAR